MLVNALTLCSGFVHLTYQNLSAHAFISSQFTCMQIFIYKQRQTVKNQQGAHSPKNEQKLPHLQFIIILANI